MALTEHISTNPFPLILLERPVLALLIAFTPSSSRLRIPVILALILYIIHVFPHFSSYIPRSAWVAFIGGETFTVSTEYVERLLLTQWDAEVRGPRTDVRLQRKLKEDEDGSRNGLTIKGKNRQRDGDKGTTDWWDRLKFGIWVASSQRYIGSPYQARNVPPYSSSIPSYIPTRRRFLLKKAGIIAICYVLVDTMMQANNNPDMNPVLYANSKIPLLGRWNEVTAEEIGIRVATSMGFYVGLYLIIELYSSTLSFLSVLSGLDQPAYNRPTFGSFSHAYTLRGFWG